MIVATLIAASYTFYATATGVTKGTPIEFVFAGKDSDRDYETLFLLESSVEDFCSDVEKAGIPKGDSPDISSCILWPVGCPIDIEPSVDEFLIRHKIPEYPSDSEIIYTGGSRDSAGRPQASSEMPMSVFSLYTLAQSPILFNGIFEQGIVYGHNLAKVTLEKGRRYKFTISWNEKTRPIRMSVTFSPGNAVETLKSIKSAANGGELVLTVRYSPEMTVKEATTVANALGQIDSKSVKINGRESGSFFYRAFLPAVKWLDRKERLVQPFELHISEGSPRLLFIEEDWSGESIDPKLTEHEISFAEAGKHNAIDTCLIYVPSSFTIGEISPYLAKMPASVRTYYVYGDQP